MLEGTELGVNPGYTLTMKGLDKQAGEDVKEATRAQLQGMIEDIF
jgi:hypothetical protein